MQQRAPRPYRGTCMHALHCLACLCLLLMLLYKQSNPRQWPRSEGSRFHRPGARHEQCQCAKVTRHIYALAPTLSLSKLLFKRIRTCPFRKKKIAVRVETLYQASTVETKRNCESLLALCLFSRYWGQLPDVRGRTSDTKSLRAKGTAY